MSGHPRPATSQPRTAAFRPRESQRVPTSSTPKSKQRLAKETEVTVDRRTNVERRGQGDRRKKQLPVAEDRRKLERRQKVHRRRQIDPTTCERDYTDDEVEFMQALDRYKRKSGRMFPTCSELLEVLRSLGYAKANHGPSGSASSPAEPGGGTAINLD